MKTKIIDNRLYTAYLLNGKGEPKLEVHTKDSAIQPAVLGPNDFVPGLEPSRGVTAVGLLSGVGGFLQTDKLNELKPAVRVAVEKFMKAPKKTETPEQKLEDEKKHKLSCAAIELFEASQTLAIISNSDQMICSRDGLTTEGVEQLRHAIEFVTSGIVKNSKIINDIVNE